MNFGINLIRACLPRRVEQILSRTFIIACNLNISQINFAELVSTEDYAYLSCTRKSTLCPNLELKKGVVCQNVIGRPAEHVFHQRGRRSNFFNVKFHNSRKCQIADFVPKFRVEEGGCAQFFCAQTLKGD